MVYKNRLPSQTYQQTSPSPDFTLSQESYIHKLPFELISQIFLYCVPVGNEELAHDNFKNQPLGFILSAVCNDWQSVALSTPRLWTYVQIRLRTLGIRSQFHITELCLHLSRSLPLSLHLLLHPGYEFDDIHLPKFLPLFHLLNTHSNRWGSLNIFLPFALASRFYGLSGSANLHAIRISHPTSLMNESGTPRSRNTFEMLGDRPKPNLVEISGLYLKYVKIDWTLVTNVRFSSLCVDECHELFHRAPGLTHCTITEVVDGNEGFDIPETPTLLSCLSHLELNFSCAVPAALILDKIHSPVLNELTIGAGSGVEECVKHLIHRSSCRLHPSYPHIYRK